MTGGGGKSCGGVGAGGGGPGMTGSGPIMWFGGGCMMATELWIGGLHVNGGWEVTKHGGDGVSVNCGGTRNGRCGTPVTA